MRGLAFDEDLGVDVEVTDRAPGGLADEVCRLTEADRPRAGQLVDLAAVAVFGQRRRGDLGDVLGVDERCAPVAGGQGLNRGRSLPERITILIGRPYARY
ncbi:MAG: hypothetical protein JWN00_2159 [Actinomycetia bacterium]|nr:hypothetical protein [Actinomycetes bacterium]